MQLFPSSNLSNKIINKKTYSTNLKLADATPERELAENYRPVSVLPTVSKMFKKFLEK